VAERKLKNRLKEIRSARELTQADLAEMVGVTRKTINTVENGIFVPSTMLALGLATALHLRVEDIFYLSP
jgi:putative transcriptional regulator